LVGPNGEVKPVAIPQSRNPEVHARTVLSAINAKVARGEPLTDEDVSGYGSWLQLAGYSPKAGEIDTKSGTQTIAQPFERPPGVLDEAQIRAYRQGGKPEMDKVTASPTMMPPTFVPIYGKGGTPSAPGAPAPGAPAPGAPAPGAPAPTTLAGATQINTQLQNADTDIAAREKSAAETHNKTVMQGQQIIDLLNRGAASGWGAPAKLYAARVLDGMNAPDVVKNLFKNPNITDGEVLTTALEQYAQSLAIGSGGSVVANGFVGAPQMPDKAASIRYMTHLNTMGQRYMLDKTGAERQWFNRIQPQARASQVYPGASAFEQEWSSDPLNDPRVYSRAAQWAANPNDASWYEGLSIPQKQKAWGLAKSLNPDGIPDVKNPSKRLVPPAVVGSQ
jgi:hypothetical protein